MKLGPALPKKIYGASMVEVGDNLYIIGGWSSNGPIGQIGFQKEIQQLSCASGLCSWKTLKQQLKFARRWLVAIPVNDIHCD